MSKQTKDIAIEALLEKEKTKNRRIVTGIIIVVAFVAGFIASYFVMKSEFSNVQAHAISSYVEVSKAKQ